MIALIIESNGWTLESSTEDESKRLKDFRAFLEEKNIKTETRFHGDGFFIARKE